MNKPISESFLSDAHPLNFTLLDKGDQPTLFLSNKANSHAMIFTLKNESKADLYFDFTLAAISPTRGLHCRICVVSSLTKLRW